MIYIFKLKLNKKHLKFSSLYLPTSYHRIVTDCLVIKWKRQNMPSHIAHYNIYLNDFLNIFLVHRLNDEWKHFTQCALYFKTRLHKSQKGSKLSFFSSHAHLSYNFSYYISTELVISTTTSPYPQISRQSQYLACLEFSRYLVFCLRIPVSFWFLS